MEASVSASAVPAVLVVVAAVAVSVAVAMTIRRDEGPRTVAEATGGKGSIPRRDGGGGGGGDGGDRGWSGGYTVKDHVHDRR